MVASEGIKGTISPSQKFLSSQFVPPQWEIEKKSILLFKVYKTFSDSCLPWMTNANPPFYHESFWCWRHHCLWLVTQYYYTLLHCYCTGSIHKYLRCFLLYRVATQLPRKQQDSTTGKQGATPGMGATISHRNQRVSSDSLTQKWVTTRTDWLTNESLMSQFCPCGDSLF